MKWVPKDPDGTVGVPGKGYIKAADFSQEDHDALMARIKNRKISEYEFMTNNKFVLAKNPELFEEELEEEEPVSDELPEGEPSMEWTAKEMTAYLESKGEKVAANTSKTKLLEAIEALEK